MVSQVGKDVTPVLNIVPAPAITIFILARLNLSQLIFIQVLTGILISLRRQQ